MRRLTVLAAIVLAFVASRSIAQTNTAPVQIFVTSVGAANGFTDPNKDNQDTMKDIRGAIKDHKNLMVTNNRDDAAIVLVVMSREKAQVTAGFLGPARDCTVRVKFLFRDSETEMSASAQGGTLASGGAWSKAAGKLVKQVDQWVVANRAQLTQSK